MDALTYPEFYGEVFASLARPLTEADQVPEGVIAANERRLGVRLPEALRAYYALAGNMRRLSQGGASAAESWGTTLWGKFVTCRFWARWKRAPHFGPAALNLIVRRPRSSPVRMATTTPGRSFLAPEGRGFVR